MKTSPRGRLDERRVVVCADDAGWEESSDEVIRKLAYAARISAVSVLVDGRTAPDWRDFDRRPQASLGLHFNLTWSPHDDGSRGLPRVIADSFTRRIGRAFAEERLQRQLARFESLYARPPDFVDGHQHVHMLPGVRDALIRVLQQRYGDSRPAIRVPLSRSRREPKAWALRLLGAGRLERSLARLQWPRNSDFEGLYGMADSGLYRRRMQAWLAGIRDGGLIMAHPGDGSLSEHGAARAAEAAYFAGDAWPRDLASAGVRLIAFTARALASGTPHGNGPVAPPPTVRKRT